MQKIFWCEAGPVDCFTLAPDNDAEREELRQAFEGQGVDHEMAFNRNGISGTLELVPPN